MIRQLYINRRLLSTSVRLFKANQEVRVRFAPSPTGNIHLGGLRTALYNYIFAKQNDGKFILRIEDTDQSRIVPGSAAEIEEVISWAGLQLDESPHLGGNYGPYVQSHRLDLYREKAQELIDSGKAYRCFCSPTRLDLLRKHQARNRQKPHYDGKCKHLTPSEIDEKLEETGGKYVIRFALQPSSTTFKDIIFGETTNNPAEIMESDPIIMKSDLFPTYHFANVVDDHLMKISHVLRGSEWLSSTAKHIQIYQAFNWPSPTFAHFPLITMEDGSKMSKRFNHSHLKYLIQAGYRPLAIVNFMTNIGGGVPKAKQDSMELWDLETVVDQFRFERVSCHPGSADLTKLNKYNSKELQKAWKKDQSEVIEQLKTLLKEKKVQTNLDDDRLRTIVDQYIDGRISTLNDLLKEENSYIWAHPELNWSLEDYQGWNLRDLISQVIVIINDSDTMDQELLSRRLHKLVHDHEINWSSFMKLLRKILTNHEKGLPVFEIVRCLGKEGSLSYLKRGLKYVS